MSRITVGLLAMTGRVTMLGSRAGVVTAPAIAPSSAFSPPLCRSKHKPKAAGPLSPETSIYQAELLHKEFPQPVNVVVIAKVNRITQQCTHVILFSSDLTLPYETLIDYLQFAVPL